MKTLLKLLYVLTLCLVASLAHGQSVETVIMPGKLTSSHAKLESDCKNCHVRFNKAGQDERCKDCHKEIRRDLDTKRGFHGRLKPQRCAACHTDHAGREARIVVLDEKKFDHSQSNFMLRGAHLKKECAACHKPGRKYREAPSTCVACHRDNDVHKGGLGQGCADCHNESNWKEAKFDHSKTDFPLLGAHISTSCKSCHTDGRYKGTPKTCIACHRVDDHHKTHFGENCRSCHVEKNWKTITFNHEQDAHFALKGKHQTAKCESCHTGFLYKDKLQATCISCHRNDDKHKGSLGPNCANCHIERSWKETRFDHSKTRFPLLGKHGDVECGACHKDQRFRETPSECITCHKKDDRHKTRFGEDCKSCHTEKSWKAWHFDHARDGHWALQGKHANTKCDSCHQGNLFKDKLNQNCVSCHLKDDRHRGTLGTACGQCHNEREWKSTAFDHNRTHFPLIGQHSKVECAQCHKTQAYKDVARDCVGCHDKQDVHKRRLGPRCETCHNSRDWRSWDFDHNARTHFKLDGAHARTTCESCHTVRIEKQFNVSMNCISCHRMDDVHEGKFGPRCEQCHLTSTFREVRSR
ncbi:cytochrome c3 family protein [Uliginosibacterium gangwonense]|uniref:cytochrome c3 family protein n=1 Tax=Uliginosibacterium gangwonense TaxID=392736 RepID=UPI000382AC1B|nr:cytochrome c3 family protein [Uliginosibacterium gangwonense]